MLSKEELQKIIRENRQFLRHNQSQDLPETDQNAKLPMPPFYKEFKNDARVIDLPRPSEKDIKNNNFFSVLNDRKSHRSYAGEDITLEDLSFMLWATQGVRGIRGNNYATLRIVPCGGARHEFESYILVMHVKGLDGGLYHYQAKDHQLEYYGSVENPEELAAEMMCGQNWVKRSSVLFFWSVIPYRAEWRYSARAHRMILVDCGHIGQNLYLAATALGLGTCGIGAFNQDLCDQTLEFEEGEQTIYSAVAGIIKEDSPE